MGYSNHRRPLYLAASIIQIPIKRALVDTSASMNLIPHNTLQAVGIPESKIQGCPMVRRKRWVYCRPHTAMAEGGSNSLLNSFSYGKDRSFLSYITRKTMVTQASPDSVYLSPVYEGKIEWQNDADNNKPITIRASRSPSSRNHVLRRMGTFWRKLNIQTTRHFCRQVGGHLGWSRA